MGGDDGERDEAMWSHLPTDGGRWSTGGDEELVHLGSMKVMVAKR